LSRSSLPPTIMILDDEPSVREALRLRLERSGYQVLLAGSYEEFVQVMADCDAILSDIILPGDSGLQALKWTREHYPNTAVIMMTGKPTFETAAEAIRLGAFDYLAKPATKDELLFTIERAVQHRRLMLEKERLEKENETYRLHLEQRVAEQTQALRESQEFLTTLTDTMADAVLSLEAPDYRIEYVNQAVVDIFGYEPKELMGQPLYVLYGDQVNFNTFVQKQGAVLMAGQKQMRLEQALRRKDGKSVWTEIVATFLYSENQLSQIITVIRDISQRSLLLGVVAHELRSPLGLITGFSQAIMDDIKNVDEESMARYLGVIHESATRMLRMADDLLDITKIELGEVSLVTEAVELIKLLENQVSAYAFVARKKDIALKAILPVGPVDCECDPIKIGQVVSNLIDNALKYSPSHTTVEIIAEIQDTKLWVGVKDQGPGIKPEETQYLFKSFGHTKISSKPTGGEKSSGLGLAICKKIIEAHGGEVGVDSMVGQGSTFWFTLPL
jgi:PAS domain S-box-containing protein